jgi:hypothetical protein
MCESTDQGEHEEAQPVFMEPLTHAEIKMILSIDMPVSIEDTIGDAL